MVTCPAQIWLRPLQNEAELSRSTGAIRGCLIMASQHFLLSHSAIQSLDIYLDDFKLLILFRIDCGASMLGWRIHVGVCLTAHGSHVQLQ